MECCVIHVAIKNFYHSCIWKMIDDLSWKESGKVWVMRYRCWKFDLLFNIVGEVLEASLCCLDNFLAFEEIAGFLTLHST